MSTIKKKLVMFFISLVCLLASPFLGFLYFGMRFDSATGSFWEGIVDLVVLSSAFIIIPVLSMVFLVQRVVSIIKLHKENYNSQEVV